MVERRGRGEKEARHAMHACMHETGRRTNRQGIQADIEEAGAGKARQGKA